MIFLIYYRDDSSQVSRKSSSKNTEFADSAILSWELMSSKNPFRRFLRIETPMNGLSDAPEVRIVSFVGASLESERICDEAHSSAVAAVALTALTTSSVSAQYPPAPGGNPPPGFAGMPPGYAAIPQGYAEAMGPMGPMGYPDPQAAAQAAEAKIKAGAVQEPIWSDSNISCNLLRKRLHFLQWRA